LNRASPAGRAERRLLPSPARAVQRLGAPRRRDDGRDTRAARRVSVRPADAGSARPPPRRRWAPWAPFRFAEANVPAPINYRRVGTEQGPRSWQSGTHPTLGGSPILAYLPVAFVRVPDATQVAAGEGSRKRTAPPRDRPGARWNGAERAGAARPPHGASPAPAHHSAPHRTFFAAPAQSAAPPGEMRRGGSRREPALSPGVGAGNPCPG
jgi:hypothetical protein